MLEEIQNKETKNEMLQFLSFIKITQVYCLFQFPFFKCAKFFYDNIIINKNSFN